MSWRGNSIAQKALDFGREVIQTPVFPTYFDYAQEVSENEPLAIGGPITLQDVLSFTPMKKVKGVQFQLWTEYIESPMHAEYMMWPRAAALAFKCWSGQENFEHYFNSRKKKLIDLGITIRDVDPLKRINISHLGVGPYFRGFDTSEMMQSLENSAMSGEVANDF